MSTFESARFYVIDTPQITLSDLSRQLYGDAGSLLASDFQRLNASAADSAGQVRMGQLVLLPDPVCYRPDVEADIVHTITRVNILVREQMTLAERQLLARQPQLLNNAASGNGIESSVRLANTAVSGMLSAVGVQSRLLGDTIRKLETAYTGNFKAHGKLTPAFYSQRQQIYRQLDTTAGRLTRTIAMGSTLDSRARQDLKISTKSQILHWQRHGTSAGVKGFLPHFDNIRKIARTLKGGGYLTIGIDTALTANTIIKACEKNTGPACHKTGAVEAAGLVGSVAIGGLGGLAAYKVCSVVFGVPSAGSSLLWCGIVVGAAGGVAGGKVGESGFKGLGNMIFEKTYPVLNK